MTQIKSNLFGRISNIKHSLLNENDSVTAETLLFGSSGLNDEENAYIIESTIEYIVAIIAMNPFKQITTFLEICN